MIKPNTDLNDDCSTVEKAINYGKKILVEIKSNYPDLSVEALLADVTGLSRQDIYTNFDFVLDKNAQKKYKIIKLKETVADMASVSCFVLGNL